MIDAAGAIYVIGGADGTTYVNDVWASTDGGTRAGLSSRGGGRGDSVGTYGGTKGYYKFT